MNLIQDNSALSGYNSSSGSDNINENGKRVKKTRNRPCKSERFTKEREEIIKELESIIGLNESTRGILLNDLEQNQDLRNYLKNMIPEIKKIYKCGTWNYFVRQHEKNTSDIDEISLLKSIFKDEKYKLISKRKLIEINGIKKQYSCLYFYKNINTNDNFIFYNNSK